MDKFNILKDNIKTTAALLYSDFDQGLILHKQLIHKYGTQELEGYIVGSMVEQGLIPVERFETTLRLFANDDFRAQVAMIDMYSNRFFNHLNKINKIVDDMLESDDISQEMKLKLIQGQVQKLLNGEIFNDKILKLYKDAEFSYQWEVVDEIVNEWCSELIHNIIGDRNPCIRPLSESEVSDTIKFFPNLSNESKGLLVEYFQGKFNLRSKPKDPEYNFRELLPIKDKESITDTPDEFKRPLR